MKKKREMARQINSLKRLEILNDQTPSKENDYKDRLVKLIPSEMVLGFVSGSGFLKGSPNSELFTGLFILFLFICTPVYLYKISLVTNWVQISFTTIGFLVWVFAIGGFQMVFPENEFFKNQGLANVILLGYSLLIPFFYKG